MKPFNDLSFLLIIFLFLTACTGNAIFTPGEMRFTGPFAKDTTIIYRSSNGYADTIKFMKTSIDTTRYRNLEQGFYNEVAVSVQYELTPNSFHKITVQNINKDPERFLLFIKAKNSHSSKHISFLGLSFDKDYIDSLLSKKDSVSVFTVEHARYKGVNINKGIKSFKFSFTYGVLSYVDEDNVTWTR